MHGCASVPMGSVCFWCWTCRHRPLLSHIYKFSLPFSIILISYINPTTHSWSKRPVHHETRIWLGQSSKDDLHGCSETSGYLYLIPPVDIAKVRKYLPISHFFFSKKKNTNPSSPNTYASSVVCSGLVAQQKSLTQLHASVERIQGFSYSTILITIFLLSSSSLYLLSCK